MVAGGAALCLAGAAWTVASGAGSDGPREAAPRSSTGDGSAAGARVPRIPVTATEPTVATPISPSADIAGGTVDAATDAPGPSPGPKAAESEPAGPRPAETGTPPGSDVPVAVALTDDGSAIRVVPVGAPDGVLVPPRDIATAGWWVGGSAPGAPGRAVITGHVDSRDGLGAFAALDDLRPGDRIRVTDAGGVVTGYRVTDRREVTKASLDPAGLTGGTAPELVLVTCTGDFDPVARSYRSNLIVTAVPDAGG